MILIGTPAAAEAARRLAAVPEETEEAGGRQPAAGKGAD